MTESTYNAVAHVEIMTEDAATPPQPGLDGAMDALATAMQQVEDAANYYKDIASEKDANIAQLEDKIIEKDTRISKLEEILRESANAMHTKDTEIAKHTEVLAAKESQLANQQKVAEKMQALEVELSAKDAELKDHKDRETKMKSFFQ